MESAKDALVRVLTVDDHPPFLAVARQVVEATPGFTWAAGVSSGEEAIAVAEDHGADFAMVDVNMPGMDGIEVARALRRARPEMLIALISAKDASELPPAAHASSDLGVVLCKEKLRPTWLREMWGRHSRPEAAE